MPVRIIVPILLLAAMTGAAAAQDDGVRIVLPLHPDGEPGKALERIEPKNRVRRLETGDVCNLIASSADEHGLPRPYFARLIWQESRFDAGAVSPVGAQGIAQFMPATALRRGLRNAFDPSEAIPASAAYLADLRRQFGNLGLAAAAYNAGEERVSRWLAAGGYLPLETENYVLTILGKPPAEFRGATDDEKQKPLDDKKPFEEACRALPVAPQTGTLHAGAPKPVWGAQVAGHFNRSVALNKWTRIRDRHRSIIGDKEPAVFAAKSARGRTRLHVVQIGASGRGEASDICNRLRIAGTACMVVRND